MPTPQDDQFSSSTLDPKWTYSESASGANAGYSLTDFPGNFEAKIKPQSQADLPANVSRLLQDTIWPSYKVTIGVTEGNLTQIGDEAGILIVENSNTFIWFALSYQADGIHVRVYKCLSGTKTLVDDVLWNHQNEIVLMVQKYDGNFTFYYKLSNDAAFQQTPSTVDGSAFGSGAGTGRQIGFGGIGGNVGNAQFSFVVDYFLFHMLLDIITNGNTYLAVTNNKFANGALVLGVKSFWAPTKITAKQYIDQPFVELTWDQTWIKDPILQSPDGSLFQIVVANDGSFGTSPVASGAPTATPIIIQSGTGHKYVVEVDDSGTLIQDDAAANDNPIHVLLTAPNASTFEFIIDIDGAFMTDPTAFLGITVVRNPNRYPLNPTDGTVLISGTLTTTLTDGPIYGRSRQYYAAFAQYIQQYSGATTDATMPIFANLYKNVGKRFSRVFKSNMWATLYAYARVLTTLVDVDIQAAWAQFNINTATGSFLDYWGKLFGARRYPSEADRPYANRILGRVTIPRTVTETIKSELLKVPGVTFVNIRDAASGSMFIGHSFIGYDGTGGATDQSDFVGMSFSDTPFYFLVEVKIKQGTNLDQILKTVEDNKAGGVGFNVVILETQP